MRVLHQPQAHLVGLVAGFESKAGVKVVQSLLYGDSPITEIQRAEVLVTRAPRGDYLLHEHDPDDGGQRVSGEIL
jgi:hypothetical protein